MPVSAMLGSTKLLRDHRGTIKTWVCSWCLLQAAPKGGWGRSTAEQWGCAGSLRVAMPGCGFQGGCRGCPCSDVSSLAVPLPAHSLPRCHPPDTAHRCAGTERPLRRTDGKQRLRGREKRGGQRMSSVTNPNINTSESCNKNLLP